MLSFHWANLHLLVAGILTKRMLDWDSSSLIHQWSCATVQLLTDPGLYKFKVHLKHSPRAPKRNPETVLYRVQRATIQDFDRFL